MSEWLQDMRWPLVFAGLAVLAKVGSVATDMEWLSGWTWLFGSLAIAAFLIVADGLRTAIWHARVPTAFAIIGVLALTVPEQVRYLIAGTQTWVQIIMLPAAVLATGVGCWFWGRWSLNLAETGGVIRGDVPVVAWNWLPRVLAVAPAVASLIAIYSASDFMETWITTVLSVLCFAAGLLLLRLAFERRKMFDEMTRNVRPDDRKLLETLFLHDNAVIHEFIVAKERDGRAAATARFRLDERGGWYRLAIRCLPFHPLVLAGPVLLFLVAAVMTMSGLGPVVKVAQTVGAAPTALVGMACLLTLLAPVAGLLAARRWPALVLLLLWVVGATAANENTMVRTTAPAHKRPALDAAARAWLETCAERTSDIRVVLVAAAGGASRAAVWGAAVLDALERGKDSPGIDPAQHLFAVSGISGGALAMSSYVALLDQAGVGCGRTPTATRDARLDGLREGLRQDFLSPALAGMFFGDAFWRALGPVSAAAHRLGLEPVERTYWLETAWERGVTLDPARRPLSEPVAARTFPDATGVPRLPLLFTAGTHQKTGRQVVTAPVVAVRPATRAAASGSAAGDAAKPDRDDSAVPGAIDASAAMESDPSFSVAASNSARFPVVTAAGLLRGQNSGVDTGLVVDGGYHDNLGTGAILAAAEALGRAHEALVKEGGRFAGTRLHLFVVQVWSDPDRVDPDPAEKPGPYTAMVPRCDKTHAVTVAAKPATPLDLVLSPLGALVAVRGARSNSGTGPIVAAYCGPWEPSKSSRRFFAFTMGPDRNEAGEKGVRPPLNWVQPERSLTAMHASGLTGFKGLGNEAQLATFQAAWCALGDANAECRKRAAEWR